MNENFSHNLFKLCSSWYLEVTREKIFDNIQGIFLQYLISWMKMQSAYFQANLKYVLDGVFDFNLSIFYTKVVVL